jgi:hypothetical protein
MVIRLCLIGLLISFSSLAATIPGYQNGRCKILKPETYDRKGHGCTSGHYAIVYDGFMADPDKTCTAPFESVVQELATSSFCTKLPAEGLCSLVYPGHLTASGTYCANGKWTFSTFDGFDILDECYDSVSDAMTKMHESPACITGKN